MEPSKVVQICLPRFASNRRGPILRIACGSSFPSGGYDFPFEPAKVNRWSPSTVCGFEEFSIAPTSHVSSTSRNRAAAASGVMSLCGVPSISKPTINLRTVAERNSGG